MRFGKPEPEVQRAIIHADGTQLERAIGTDLKGKLSSVAYALIPDRRIARVVEPE